MGTAGALGLVADLNDTFPLMNGSILTALEYAASVDRHRAQGATCMGICLLEPAALHMLQREQPLDGPDLMHRLQAAGHEALAYPYDGCRWEIGRPDDNPQAGQDVDRARDQLIPRSSAGAGKTF